MNKQYFIYLTINQINKKKYVGKHYGFTNDSYLGSGVLLQKAIKKFGKENFSRKILEICKSEKEMNTKEKEWIKKLNAVNNNEYYNISEGDEIGSGWKYAHQWNKAHPEQAKKRQQEAIARLRKWEKTHPEEREKNTQKLIQGSKEWRKNNPEQVKKIMKKVNLAKEEWQKAHPEEHQKQVNEWRQAGSIANSQKILCITTGKIFNSQSEAARFYGIIQGNISKALKGERKSAGKHPTTKEKLFWKLI